VRDPRLLPRRFSFLAILLAVLAVPLAHAKQAAPPAAEPADPPVDTAAIKDKLMILSDGKQHFVALIPFGEMSDPMFYGDGKTFWAQRVFSFSKSDKENFRSIFWEPRGAKYSSVGFMDGKYTVSCDERKVELAPLSEVERDAMLASAKFYPARWKHRAYALARDNEGKYYYVDRLREPEHNLNFRLYVGPRGNMKLQKMINVVSDSEGDIFATKSGSLRLVMDKHETSWIQGKKKTPLTSLPVDQNQVLIHADLGAYTGQRLGTPCDDL
jgi:hypothetical protein